LPQEKWLQVAATTRLFTDVGGVFEGLPRITKKTEKRQTQIEKVKKLIVKRKKIS
jgi:hypothetical protein